MEQSTQTERPKKKWVDQKGLLFSQKKTERPKKKWVD